MESEQDAITGDVAVVTSHLAYFFVPLPDLLGLPERYVLELLEHTPLERVVNEDLPQVSFGASLCFHHVDMPATITEEQTALFELAKRSLPNPPEMNTRASDPDEPVGFTDPIVARSHATTVVEMAIAIELSETESKSTEEEHNAKYRNQLSEAFDRGLAYVRQFQRAYYLSRREPIRLITRESLPFAVPFGIRQLFDDDGEPLTFEVQLSMYFLNTNIPTPTVTPWSDDDDARLNTAIAQQADEGPFTAYIDLIRESDVALVRDGAYRSAVIFAASACEVLLDDLLAHMMWEEERRPEDAASLFESSITKRVKTQYHERLGGSWNPESEGPIGDWFVQVAQLRNRVVHGGYEPTFEEATKAVGATSDLSEHLGDLVGIHAKTYPRTALVLPGEDGLIRRENWSRALEDLRNDPSETEWIQTFARWRLAMQRARKDSTFPEEPSMSGASVCVVIRTDGSEQWIVHDPRAGMAAVIPDVDDLNSIPPQQRASVRTIVDSRSEEARRIDVSIFISGAEAIDVPTGRWVPEYRLVPLTGVMVTGNDLDPA